MTVRTSIAVSLVVGCCYLYWPSRANASTELSFERIVFDDGVIVTLEPVSDPSTINGERSIEMDSVTAPPRFHFGVDTSDAQWTTDDHIRYFYFYFRERAGAVQRFKVSAKVIENKVLVSDRDKKASFNLRVDGVSYKGEIDVPLASGARMAALTQQTPNAFQEPRLNGASNVRISLRNELDRHSVVVEVPATIPSPNTRLWPDPISLTASSPDGLITPRAGLDVDLTVTPRPFEALQLSLAHFGKDEEQTRIEVPLHYHSMALKNRQGTITAIARLRFRPSVPMLLAALISGSVIGSVLRLSWKKGAANRWFQETGIAFGAACVLWGLGLFLVGVGDSEFKVFGWNLDPWQVPPTMALSLATGVLGAESRDAVKRLLKIT